MIKFKAYESVQYDIQDFDPRWEQALLSTSDPLSDKFL